MLMYNAMTIWKGILIKQITVQGLFSRFATNVPIIVQNNA